MTEQQDQKLQQLQAAYDDAYQTARHKPTVVNRRALKTAEKKLSEYQQQLAQNSGEPIYRNIREMVAALDADGWKLSDSRTAPFPQALPPPMPATTCAKKTAPQVPSLGSPPRSKKPRKRSCASVPTASSASSNTAKPPANLSPATRSKSSSQNAHRT